MGRRKRKQKERTIPFSWRASQIAGCGVFSVALFFGLYFKFMDGLYTSTNSLPNPTEKLVFSLCFAFFFTCMAAVFSNVIMGRIWRKESMADIAEAIAKEVASEALDVLGDGVGTAASGSTGGGSTRTKGGGGSFGGGGASGKY